MNTERWLPIRYRDFYDIPRAFVVENHGETLLFNCPFDEAADDYPDHYTVIRLDQLAITELDGSWEHLANRGSTIRQIPTSQVRFDPSRRAAVDAASLDVS